MAQNAITGEKPKERKKEKKLRNKTRIRASR